MISYRTNYIDPEGWTAYASMYSEPSWGCMIASAPCQKSSNIYFVSRGSESQGIAAWYTYLACAQSSLRLGMVKVATFVHHLILPSAERPTSRNSHISLLTGKYTSQLVFFGPSNKWFNDVILYSAVSTVAFFFSRLSGLLTVAYINMSTSIILLLLFGSFQAFV
jgi:hypothetical protein